MKFQFPKARIVAAAGAVLATLTMSMISPVTKFQDDNELVGAGSSFDYPLFTKQFAEYGNAKNVKVNYQSVGSGAGISQLTNRTVDFGATDAPMNGKQDSALPAPAIHIPVTAGAVVLSYNLPGVGKGLQLNPSVLADIFLGTITNWNDSRIAAINKGMSLPN